MNKPRHSCLVAALAVVLLSACETAPRLPSAATPPAPPKMQVIVAVDGKPQLQAMDRPTPGRGEVLVKVRAAGVNPADWKRAARPGTPPFTPGWDIAGVITAVGPGVTGWRTGDAVMGFFEGAGGYSEYVAISTENIARKPSRLDFEQAAGLPLVAVTAWKALVEVADLQKGQRVLIHGAAGGVGSAAVQIAVARGAHVIATASARNHGFVRSIGASETVDYTAVKFEERVANVDVVLNTVDEETAVRSLRVLKPTGIMVTVAGSVPTEACTAARMRCAVQSRKTGATIGQVLAEVGRLADARRFSINVDARFPLARTGDAWDLSRTGHTRGKIILTMTP